MTFSPFWKETRVPFSFFRSLPSTTRLMFGFRRSNLDFRFLPNNNWAGLCPVVACGAVRYANRNLSSLCWIDRSDLSALTAFLKLWTMRSAKPLVDGWYGAPVTCRIPFISVKYLNSPDTNWGPLSDTTCSGRPILANKDRRVATVSAAVVFRI